MMNKDMFIKWINEEIKNAHNTSQKAEKDISMAYYLGKKEAFEVVKKYIKEDIFENNR